MGTEIKKVEASGTEFSYVEQGQGDPRTQAHGSLNDYHAWNLQLEFLSRRHHVIVYSR